MLYLTEGDVERMAPSPSALTDGIARAFAQHHDGVVNLPAKTVMRPREAGAAFYAMPVAIAGHYGGIKWLGSAPRGSDIGVPHISGLFLLNDPVTGRVLAVMEAGHLTGIRTAALSLLAARFLAPDDSETIGLVGCGLQARAHVEALRAEFPISRVLVLGGSQSGTETFVRWAQDLGLAADENASPTALLRDSEIVVSTVPASAGLRPFLDAGQMKARSFASLVDLGRSWVTETLGAFDAVYTDDEAQSAALAPHHQPFAVSAFAGDLASLVSEPPGPPGGRAAFLFGGTALADLATGAMIFERARELGIGRELPEGAAQ